MSWDGSRNVPKCQKDVKLSKRCQMSKIQTPRLWRRFTKKLNWHNEVHRYWHQFWHHKWWSLKTLKMFIESIFGQFWWPSYLMSKLMSISVNLIMSIYFFLWTSSIVQMFDYLTSFWQRVWGTRGMGNGVQGYCAYGQWGTGGMGHIGNGSHGQWGTGVWGIWAMRPLGV